MVKKFLKMKIINYARQSISRKDIASVVKVLKSDYLTQGPNIKLFFKILKFSKLIILCLIAPQVLFMLHVFPLVLIQKFFMDVLKFFYIFCYMWITASKVDL